MPDQKAYQLPALDPALVPLSEPNPYPEPFHSRIGKTERRALGEAYDLTKLGVSTEAGWHAAHRDGLRYEGAPIHPDT